MHSRFLAGWKGALLATAIAGLVVFPITMTFATGLTSEVQHEDNGGLGPVIGEAEEIQGPKLYSRVGYSWPFAKGPFYEGPRDHAPGVLVTAVGNFDLGRGMLGLPAELSTPDRLGEIGAQHFILQVHPDLFAAGEFDSLRQAIEASGGAILDAMPVGAFIVRMTPAALGAVEGQSGVMAVLPYQAAFKLSPNVGRVPLPNPYKAASEVYDLEIQLHRGQDAGLLAGVLVEMGGNVISVDPDMVRVEMHRGKLPQIAQIDSVRQILEHVPNFPKAQETTATMQLGSMCASDGTCFLGPNDLPPYHRDGIKGVGELIMVLDSGIQLDAPELSDTRSNAGSAGGAHRKVQAYESTVQFGGSGDLLGCDNSANGSFTHGHTVSATALGLATNVDQGTYGSPWYALDFTFRQWSWDGVAPGARLIAYDGNVTSANCGDPNADGIFPGNLYNGGTSSALGKAQAAGARLHNFSWGGQNNNVYGTNASRIDDYLDDNRNGMVFVSAGNDSVDDNPEDGIPDPSTISDPATCKNCLVIGSTWNADDLGTSFGPDGRSGFSSVGPVDGDRTAPLLMAPGSDVGSTGVQSEFNCRTGDNDQANPVVCDKLQGSGGTSFSSPAAAGAGALVRDYFKQGFYPAGAAGGTAYGVSGAQLKAIMIASADWVGIGNSPGPGLSLNYRFNREQGYGRIQLDNALPLQSWSPSPVGLIVADGDYDLADGLNRANNTTLPGSISASDPVQEWTFTISDPTSELRIALAWTESNTAATTANLDLELVSPSGKIYYGNYFTDDNNRDGAIDGGEDCNGFDGLAGFLDASPWSLPTCPNSVRDDSSGAATRTFNTSEGIFLSPDPDDDGETDDGLSQIETGDWTLRIDGSGYTGSQPYAVALAGGVSLASSARFNSGNYVCNSNSSVTVTELDETGDPAFGLSTDEISARTTVMVFDPSDLVNPVDTETGLTFTQPDGGALRFVSNDIVMSAGLAPDPGNGALDVFSGAVLRVEYQDEDTGTTNPDPSLLRRSQSAVDCSTAIGFGNLVFARVGRDTPTTVNGGCERNARGAFEFGFPDEHIDNGEQIMFGFAFFNDEITTLTQSTASLSCVIPDGDSPEECRPGTESCGDPNRENNLPCPDTWLEIQDSPKLMGNIPAGAAMAAHFLILGKSAPAEQEIEFLLGVSSATSGKQVEGLAAARAYLEADDDRHYYSTDHPGGGTEFRDYVNDEVLENPTTVITDGLLDYRFENRTWESITATGRNGGISAPWNFDLNRGGFKSGLGAISDETTPIGNTIALWGEDKNFDDTLQAGNEDRDPVNGLLDRGWSTRGGCGWQTLGAGGERGVWHTGLIGSPGNPGASSCLVDGALQGNAACQSYEVYTSSEGTKSWFELLLTPVVEQVNDTYDVEIVNWAWNMSMQLADEYVLFTWEFDTDTTSGDEIDLVSDGSVLNLTGGPFGTKGAAGSAGLSSPDLKGVNEEGYPVFAPFDGNGRNTNGSAGADRVGENGCYFEDGTSAEPWGTAFPPDDDTDNNGSGGIDEFVFDNGPIRNFDVTTFNGPDMRFSTLEDLYGDSGPTFQGALGFFVTEVAPGDPLPSTGFGVAVDDMVIEWSEIERIPDGTPPCATGGQCAVLDLDVTNFYEGSAVLTVTLVENSPDGANDCNLDGTPDGTTDCDSDGVRDIPVEVYNDQRQDSEIIFLNAVDGGVAGGPVFKGTISISATYDVDGVLFVQRNGTDLPSLNVDYWDNDDGTGAICNNDPNLDGRGLVQNGTAVLFPVGDLFAQSFRLVDNGDVDGIADTNETIDAYLTVRNGTGVDLNNVTARLSTTDARIACVSSSVATLATLAADSSVELAVPFQFQVASDANRAGAFDDFAAEFTVTLNSDEIDSTIVPQTVVFDLDLNITAGGGEDRVFTESFEGTTNFGQFTSMTLDVAAKGSNANSDGLRCQYNNPDFVNATSYGNTQCFLGAGIPFFPETQFDWHLHTTSDPDGGRAFSSLKSLHLGNHGTQDPNSDTTTLGQMDAVRLTAPVHTRTDVNADLSFKHQVSLIDDRTVNAPGGETPDRGIVMAQLANNAGSATGNWIKLDPYKNAYNDQGTDNFFECMFDPVDDGTDEDDFFDPLDPDRRLGPSSTCFPEFVFTNLGDTDYRNTFDVNAIGEATEGPGLQGETGNGTWVESAFSLDRFRGRSLRMRFLYTSIQVQPGLDTVLDLFPLPDGWAGDDGWYIDDVEITGLTSEANTVTADGAPNGGLPNTCGQACSSPSAVLTTDADLDTTPAPGHDVTVSAAGSSTTTCVDGTLQYRFWLDDSGNGSYDPGADTLLRDWTDNATYLSAPFVSAEYWVSVRCSSDTSCISDTSVIVTVDCPSSGNAGFSQPIGFGSKTLVSWATTANVDAIRGNLDTLASTSLFDGSVETCLLDNQNASSFNDNTTPSQGSAIYYLVRGTGAGNACNAAATWNSNGAKQDADRDPGINADGNSCP